MKNLFKTESSFKGFIKDHTGYDPSRGQVTYRGEDPEKYPCIFVWNYEDDYNGPMYIDGEFIYLDDFDEY